MCGSGSEPEGRVFCVPVMLVSGVEGEVQLGEAEGGLKVPKGETEGDIEKAEGDIEKAEGDTEEAKGYIEEAEGDIKEAEKQFKKIKSC